MELEITWRRVARIWLSYFWRNLIAIIVAMVIGGIVGFIIGFLMFAVGFHVDTIKIVTTQLGGLIGLLISIVPMKQILGMNFGEFRLVLVATEVQSTLLQQSNAGKDNVA